ncbi:MAG: hypothetical protein JOZ73_12235 [Solirubrobacterales bacterium]|nr:hypothetical protein [Solirubrobacterales bacterium]
MTHAGSAVFLDGLAQAADAAAAAVGGGVEQLFQIGPLGARVRLAGPPELEQVTIPLGHLRKSSLEREDLCITVCDGAWCGVPAPVGPGVSATNEEGEAVRALAAGGAGFFLRHGGALTAFSRELGSGWFWTAAPRRDAPRPAFYPLSPILAGALAQHDVYLLPAAAVGSEQGCVLLIGLSGSGKSHVMQACVQAGLQYLGYDASLIVCEEPPAIHSIYCTTHASQLTLELMPSLATMVVDSLKPTDEHVTILLHDHLPTALLKEARLRAIAIVDRGPGQQTRLSPATRAEALSTLAPWAIRNAPGAGQAMLKALSQAVQRTPVLRLEWGREPAGIATAVEAIL